jgi:TrmH family RNA methyltransferase
MMAFLSFSVTSCRGFQILQRPSSISSSSSFGRLYSSRQSDDNRNNNSNNNSNIITSSKSQTVKTIKALLTKRKKRNEFGQTVVEGPRMVFDLLENPKTTNLVRQVLVSAQNEYDFRDDYRSRLFPSLDDNDNNENQEKKKQDVFVQLVHPDVFNKDCTDTISPQGIVAIVDIPNNNDGDDSNVAAATTNTIGGTPMYLVLDGVSDPGNLGTLLRTSLACNVAGVVLLPDCCDVWNPKAVRSAMGASFQIPIIESSSWNDALLMLKSKGVQMVYAATMIENDNNDDGDAPNSSVSYYDVNWTDGPSALVIGSEGNGLSTMVRQDLIRKKKTMAGEENDIVVGATHIPMGAGIESLNAAVCGSVILFEYSRQCAKQRSPFLPLV